MKTILDTLERARLAATPSDALTLADALADLDEINDALADLDLSEVAGALVSFKLLRDHIATQPFDVSDTGQDEFDAVTVQETTPGAFAEWLAELERLAG